eukprot:SAG31_NODE_886_length_11229_cov_19.134142_4_plen_144_part_00
MFVFVKQASLTLPTTSDFKPECTEVTWGGELEVAEESTWQRDQLSATHSHDQNTSAAVESQLSVTDAVGPIAQMAAKAPMSCGNVAAAAASAYVLSMAADERNAAKRTAAALMLTAAGFAAAATAVTSSALADPEKAQVRAAP